MKIFIWFCVALVFSIIKVTLSHFGVLLGGIPTVLILLALGAIAKKLCDKWDKTHSKPNKTQEKPLTPNPLMSDHTIPQSTEIIPSSKKNKSTNFTSIALLLGIVFLIGIIVLCVLIPKTPTSSDEFYASNPQKILIKVEALSRISDNGEIGSNWTKEFSIIGVEPIGNGEYWYTPGDTITFVATITEHDVYDDIGKGVSTLTFTDEDLTSRFTITQNVDVYENEKHFLNTNHKTTWVVTYIVQPKK